MFRVFTGWLEAEDTYALSAVNTLQEAVNTILKFLGLAAANMSEKVSEGTHTHTLLCSGKHRHNSTYMYFLYSFIRYDFSFYFFTRFRIKFVFGESVRGDFLFFLYVLVDFFCSC